MRRGSIIGRTDAIVLGYATQGTAEEHGWIFSSLPLDVRAVAGGIEVTRLRQLVSPSGELGEEVSRVHLDSLDPGRFEAEARLAELCLRERLVVAATDDHVGSVISVLEAA